MTSKPVFNMLTVHPVYDQHMRHNNDMHNHGGDIQS